MEKVDGDDCSYHPMKMMLLDFAFHHPDQLIPDVAVHERQPSVE